MTFRVASSLQRLEAGKNGLGSYIVYCSMKHVWMYINDCKSSRQGCIMIVGILVTLDTNQTKKNQKITMKFFSVSLKKYLFLDSTTLFTLFVNESIFDIN